MWLHNNMAAPRQTSRPPFGSGFVLASPLFHFCFGGVGMSRTSCHLSVIFHVRRTRPDTNIILSHFYSPYAGQTDCRTSPISNFWDFFSCDDGFEDDDDDDDVVELIVYPLPITEIYPIVSHSRLQGSCTLLYYPLL